MYVPLHFFVFILGKFNNNSRGKVSPSNGNADEARSSNVALCELGALTSDSDDAESAHGDSNEDYVDYTQEVIPEIPTNILALLQIAENIEFLNDVKCSGIPKHIIVLKAGVPIMLIQNIDQSAGMCNGTRLIVTALTPYIIVATTLFGSKTGKPVYIPRLSLTPFDTDLPFKFSRRQFPITVCFAMTINKSQCQ
ncbi:uncharacterized protein LOC130736568 [Lotus japonicus]|uniref:uncharacterized protein LOC130736568 n=1 Tax=Lotus japonicus TaxID=34305 RepID=UPI00258D5A64|nr:uncharacterized protein LOC130736568 [Lotus japonicus]